MHLNWQLLHQHRKALEQDLRALKARMRKTPTPWPEPFGAQCSQLKSRATLLYCIAAQARGRLHLRTCLKAHARLGLPPIAAFTREDQAKLIGERWKEYAP
jgi:hypothetical protein